ncbi:MAG TPA: hypothetical protein VFV02_03395 [Acidimicrobiales bacterium]|nr:hypothetical protein [Acidimicrobiales bacterium]
MDEDTSQAGSEKEEVEDTATEATDEDGFGKGIGVPGSGGDPNDKQSPKQPPQA